MTVEKEGIKYIVNSSDGNPVALSFCHRDEQGTFQHGLTHEQLVEVLTDRFKMLVRRSPTPSNMEVLTLLTKVGSSMKRRSKSKSASRKNKAASECTL